MNRLSLIIAAIAFAAAAAWALRAPSPDVASEKSGGAAACCHQAPDRTSMLQAK
ncbi:MAG: hypothetical protein ABMA01_16430 [Chthoniobacteraceae bacterium]